MGLTLLGKNSKYNWIKKSLVLFLLLTVILSTVIMPCIYVNNALAYDNVSEDFEWGNDGDSLATSGGTVTWTVTAAGTSKADIDTAQHYAGTRSGRFYRDGTNIPIATFSLTAISNSQVISFYIRKDDTSSFAFTHGNGIKRFECRILATEVFDYWDGAAHTIETLSINTWYHIEIKNVNWTTGTYDIYRDGVLKVTGATMATSASYNNTLLFDNFAGTSEAWIDNITVTTTLDIDSLKVEGQGKDWVILKGYVANSGGFTLPSVGFEYGLTTAYGSSETITGSYETGDYFVATIRGLTQGTTYHWRAVSGSDVGSDMYFTTLGSPLIYEYYTTGGDGDSGNMSGANWWAMQFTTGNTSHTVTNIRAILKKVGSPGTLIISLKHADGSGMPTGLDLTSGTYDGNDLQTSYSLIDVEVTEYSISSNSSYAIVIRALDGDASNYIVWQKDTGGGLANAVGSHSTNNGITWTSDTPADYLFEIWGNPCLEIYSANVFEDYIEDGDMLFVMEYLNIYPDYANLISPQASFQIRLLDTDGLTLLAATSMVYWNDAPASIYLSPTQANSITYGSELYMSLYGIFDPNPSTSYQIQVTEWQRANLKYLDDWLFMTAVSMDLYYGYSGTAYDLITNVSDTGWQFTSYGGAFFTSTIQRLSDIRPDLFQLRDINIPYTSDTATQAFDAAHVMTTIVGTRIAADAATIGNLFGLSAQNMLTFTIIGLGLVLLLFVAGKGGEALSTALLLLPLIIIGNLNGIIGIQWTMLFASIAFFMFVRKYWWTST